MREEHREGLELRIEESEGFEKITVTNWPGSLDAYTNKTTKDLTNAYCPGAVYNSILHGAWPQVELGRAFKSEDRSAEEAAHAIVAMSGTFGEFVGLTAEALTQSMGVLEYLNHHLGQTKSGFRVQADASRLTEAVDKGYLTLEELDGTEVYFPTEKSVSAMCDRREHRLVKGMAMWTGLNPGGL